MNKTFLLIGGSYGIGNKIIDLLPNESEIIVASRTKEGLLNKKVKHITFNATEDTLSLEELPSKIDGFVYCPGSINLRPFRGLKSEAFLNDFELNVLGAVKCLQIIQPLLAASEQASVVLFSTVAVQTGIPFHASVATSKGALEGLGRSLAAEWAPKIRVNLIASSITDTPLANRFLNNEIKKEKSSLRHPLKRIGSVNDVAELAVFLLTEKSSWMTGQVIGLDGGISTLNIN
ncbi:MAG: oxidoreductase [Flavobacteriales bacterium]|nr:oxidoreductase [Flavobacteriales bacterium]